MKYTYRLPIFEAPGDAFAKMSDDEFKKYQQGNPATAEKADRVRKQAQARAAKAGAKPASSTSTSTTKSSPSGKKEVGTSAITKRGAIVKSNSQGNKSNQVSGSGSSKRVSSAGGTAVDMGVKKVKVRDVTPGQKKMSGSASSSGSSSGSGGQKKLPGSGETRGNRRPPSGAGQKDDTREKGGALAKRQGPPGTPKKKGGKGMGLRAKGHIAAKALGWAAKVAKDTIGGATAAFGKSSWKEGITFRQYLETAVPILEANLQEKPGDGYLGPTMKIGGKPYGIPNPIRIAQDVADTRQSVDQAKVDFTRRMRVGNASMPKWKPHNKQNSTATKVLLPGIEAQRQRASQYNKEEYETQQQKAEYMMQRMVNQARGAATRYDAAKKAAQNVKVTPGSVNIRAEEIVSERSRLDGAEERKKDLDKRYDPKGGGKNPYQYIPVKKAQVQKEAKSDGDPCWDTHEMKGMKKKGNRMVPNCVRKEQVSDWRSELDLQEKEFKSHKMYDPKTGKGYDAETEEDHLRMKKMGYTHEKPEKKNCGCGKDPCETYGKKEVKEDWQKSNRKDGVDGMSQSSVNAYKRENPGSKLKTAVTGKVKKGSKDAKRRKSFCSRSKGQKDMHNIDCSKTPDKKICKARKRWRC